MGYNGSYQAQLQITGPGFGAGGSPFLEDTGQTTPGGTNVPPPESFTLQVGLNTLLLPPATFAFSRAMLLPPAGSTNAKSFTDSAGTHTALSGWTGGSNTVCCVPGGSIWIVSAGVETLTVGYAA